MYDIKGQVTVHDDSKATGTCTVRVGDVAIMLPTVVCNRLPTACRVVVERGSRHDYESALSLVASTVRCSQGCSVLSGGGIIARVPVESLMGDTFCIRLLPTRHAKSQRR